MVVEQPIVVLHWSEGDGEASFPHTLVVLGEGSQATVLDRFEAGDLPGFRLFGKKGGPVRFRLSGRARAPIDWAITWGRRG